MHLPEISLLGRFGGKQHFGLEKDRDTGAFICCRIIMMTDERSFPGSSLEKKRYRFGLLLVVLLGHSLTKCASTVILSSQRQLSVNIDCMDYSCQGNASKQNCSQLSKDMCLNASGCEVIDTPNDMEWLLIHIPSTTIYVLIGFLVTWNEEYNMIPFACSGMMALSLSISLTPIVRTSAQLILIECLRMAGASLFQNFAQSCWLCLIPGKGTSAALATTFAILGTEAGRLFVVLSPNFQTTCWTLCVPLAVAGVSLILFRKVTNNELKMFQTPAADSSSVQSESLGNSGHGEVPAQGTIGSPYSRQLQGTTSDSAEGQFEMMDAASVKESFPSSVLGEKKVSRKEERFWRGPILAAVLGWLFELVGSKTWAALYFNFLTVQMESDLFAMYTAVTTCLFGIPLNILLGTTIDGLKNRQKVSPLIYLVIQSVVRFLKVTFLVVLVLTSNSLVKIIFLCANDMFFASYVYSYVISSGGDMVKIGGILNNVLVISSQVLSLLFVGFNQMYRSETALIIMTAGFPGASVLIYVSVVLFRKCDVFRFN